MVDLAKALDQAVKQKSTVGTKGQELTIAAALAVTSHNYAHPRAKDALLHLAYLYPEELNHELLAMIMSESSDEARQLIPEAQAMLAALAEFSVVQPKPGGGYAMHRLVQEAARLEDEEHEVGERVVMVLDAVIKAVSEKGAFKDGYPLIPHLANIVELSTPELGEHDLPSYYAMARWAAFLWQSGRHQASDDIYEKVQARIASAKGMEHADYATLINNRATLKRALGDYPGAEKLCRQAIEIGQKAIGKEHPEYAIHLNNLAGALEDQGKLPEAEKLYRQAMDIDEKTIGKEHPNYATDLNNLAGVLKKQGNSPEAEKLYRQAMDIGEKTIGKEHPSYAIRLNNLARVLEEQGKFTEAEDLYRQAMDIGEKTIGKEHPSYAMRLNNLAGVLRAQGRVDEALEPLRQAVDICLRTLGPEHPSTLLYQNNLDIILNEMKSRA
ncbi:MAG: tetratricopeptide repeat protein [Proteobacteria bacterium]|nr:tetratricopeptide repeat protein [Pseudomonadota bacterium]